MKKLVKPILWSIMTMFLMFSLFGCYGNMTLTKKVWAWNGSLGSEPIQTLVMWGLTVVAPVYEIALLGDILFLNTVEYWTGTNPLAMADGATDVRIVKNDGKTFEIKTMKNSITITETAGPNSGKSVEISFDEATSAWNMSDGSQEIKLAQMSDNTLNLIYPNGKTMAIDLGSK